MSEFPGIHPRHFAVRKARIEIGEAISKAEKAHNLTPSEIFLILAGEIQTLAEGCVRTERAQNSD